MNDEQWTRWAVYKNVETWKEAGVRVERSQVERTLTHACPETPPLAGVPFHCCCSI
jgi:hypothetical protein